MVSFIVENSDNLMQLPLGGDLLGRERITGAKRLRTGCDEADERFDNITEVSEYWHAKQSLLNVMVVFFLLLVCSIICL